MTESPLLELRDLSTSFRTDDRTVRVIELVNLKLRRGRTLGLVGESGSGKSITALSIMGLLDRNGFIEPGGQVVFEGRDLASLSERELRALRGYEISMIFQEPMTSLNPTMRVGDQVAEVVHLHAKVPKAEAQARAIRMLDAVGIVPAERRARDYPHQLLGGMRQRVMIAMALIWQPKLLIADEPTTALDITTQAQILRLLREMRRDRDMALLLITHDLGVVAAMAEDIAVMYAGQIVEQGAVAEVLQRPRHPYTRALIGSMPRVRMEVGERLHVIPGSVPTPGSWPSGCRFRARCELAFDRCATEPPLFDLGERTSRCWLDAPDVSTSGSPAASVGVDG